MKIIKLVTNILLGFLNLISFIGTLIFAPWFQESSMEEKTDSKVITYFSKQTFNLNEETESDFSINMEGLHMVSLLFEENYKIEAKDHYMDLSVTPKKGTKLLPEMKGQNLLGLCTIDCKKKSRYKLNLKKIDSQFRNQKVILIIENLDLHTDPYEGTTIFDPIVNKLFKLFLSILIISASLWLILILIFRKLSRTKN